MPFSNLIKTSMQELGRISPQEFKDAEKMPVYLVLDNIRSLQNVGSFFRTADAFRIAGLYLCGITGVPPNREIEKTALGATESVFFEFYEHTCDAVEKLKSMGVCLVAIEQTNKSTMLQDFEPKKEETYAFIFGNEVFGVNEDVLQKSSRIIEIPQFGTKHSFNVSVSAGIVLWDYYLKTSLNCFSNPS